MIFETKRDEGEKHPKNDPLICDISNDLDKDHTLALFPLKWCAFVVIESHSYLIRILPDAETLRLGINSLKVSPQTPRNSFQRAGIVFR